MKELISNMSVGFSYIGFIWLIMLLVPNFIWTRNIRVLRISNGCTICGDGDPGEFDLLFVGGLVTDDEAVSFAEILVFDAAIAQSDTVGSHFLVNNFDVKCGRQLEFIEFKRCDIMIGQNDDAPDAICRIARSDVDF